LAPTDACRLLWCCCASTTWPIRWRPFSLFSLPVLGGWSPPHSMPSLSKPTWFSPFPTIIDSKYVGLFCTWNKDVPHLRWNDHRLGTLDQFTCPYASYLISMGNYSVQGANQSAWIYLDNSDSKSSATAGLHLRWYCSVHCHAPFSSAYLPCTPCKCFWHWKCP
jgi:hypothetical protein